MKKKILAAVLGCLLALFPFAACDSGNNGGGTNQPPVYEDAPIICTVKFEMPDGSVLYKNVEKGKALTEIPPLPQSDEVGIVYAWSVADFSCITTNIRVSLIKVASSYTITYDLENIADITLEATTQTVEYGKAYVLYTPSRVNYLFMGWVDEEGNPFESGNYSLTRNITLKAVWEEDHSGETYTITYDLEGIEGITIACTTQTVEYGKAYTLETPIRPAYLFMGWVDEEGNAFESGNYSLTRNITLKAVWADDGGWSDNVVKPKN